jgi:hypothetical protein
MMAIKKSISVLAFLLLSVFASGGLIAADNDQKLFVNHHKR